MADYGGLVKRAVEAAKGFRAFHASPHDFEKFDLSKIGTGQGAASYGKGIYVAENPAVSGVGGEYWKEFAQPFIRQNDAEGLATMMLQRTGGNRADAARELRDSVWALHYPNQTPGALKLLESDKKIGPRVYELQINRDPSEFLNWDKPLSQQSPYVRSAIAPLLEKKIDKEALEKFHATPAEGLLGQQFYEGLQFGSRGAQSQALLDRGVPGIRYLDAGSRQQMDIAQQLARARRPELEATAAAERPPPTSNAVLFGTDYIDILKKYGIVGAPAGMAAGAMAPGEAQAGDVIPLPPVNVAQRNLLRQQLLQGKARSEAAMPQSNVVLPMDFLVNAIGRRE